MQSDDELDDSGDIEEHAVVAVQSMVRGWNKRDAPEGEQSQSHLAPQVLSKQEQNLQLLTAYRPEVLYEDRFVKGLLRSSGMNSGQISNPTPGPASFKHVNRKEVFEQKKGSRFGDSKQKQTITGGNEVAMSGDYLMFRNDYHGDKDRASLEISMRTQNAMMQSETDRAEGEFREKMRETAHFGFGNKQGPTTWSCANVRLGGGSAEASPGPQWDTSQFSSSGQSMTSDGRDRYLGRTMEFASQRHPGDCNSGGATHSEKLMSFGEFLAHPTPSPATYNVQTHLTDVNSATFTAPRMVPKQNFARKIPRRRKNQEGHARKMVNSGKHAGANPEMVVNILRKFRDHMQFTHFTLGDVLKCFDTDDSGALSLEELGSACADLKVGATPAEVRALINWFDQDGDHEISLEELQHAVDTYERDPTLAVAATSVKGGHSDHHSTYHCGTFKDAQGHEVAAQSTVSKEGLKSYNRDIWAMGGAEDEATRLRKQIYRQVKASKFARAPGVAGRAARGKGSSGRGGKGGGGGGGLARSRTASGSVGGSLTPGKPVPIPEAGWSGNLALAAGGRGSAGQAPREVGGGGRGGVNARAGSAIVASPGIGISV
jgi:hypothetical protein